MTEHGHCPSCREDLNGGLIWQTFKDKGYSDSKADEVASLYGATRGEGRWGLQIGIYSQEEDRTVRWSCPFCNFEWKR